MVTVNTGIGIDKQMGMGRDCEGMGMQEAGEGGSLLSGLSSCPPLHSTAPRQEGNRVMVEVVFSWERKGTESFPPTVLQPRHVPALEVGPGSLLHCHACGLSVTPAPTPQPAKCLSAWQCAKTCHAMPCQKCRLSSN